MNRVASRVEPLPAPFVLPPDLASASSMHGRLMLLAVPQDDAGGELYAELASRPGVRTAAAGSRLFAHGLDIPWHQFQRTSDVGLGPLVSSREFLGAIRRLADDLLSTAAGDGVLLDWSPEHANVASVQAARSMFPDATIVVRPDLAAELPPDTRDSITVVAPGDGVPPLPEPSPAAHPAPPRDVAPASPMADKLVVIVGCGRSGTTWLEQLFLAHPRIGGVPRSESWVFQQLHWLWANYNTGSGLADLLDESILTAALRRYCDTLFTAALARHSPEADYFVEKSPVHSERLPEIAAVYPDAWVVHMLRDGRDVARSISQVPFFGRPDPGDAAELWQDVVTTVRHDATATPRFRELRYEHLHDDPVSHMTAALRWAGLEVDPEVAAAIEAAAGERVSEHAGTKGQVGSGSWRTLPAAEVARIHRRAATQLRATGYAGRLDIWRAMARAPLSGRRVHAMDHERHP
jgi:hypothetical protein